LVRSMVLSDLGQGKGRHHGHGGIQAIAAAIFKSLSAQDVTGTDAADDVLKKIETSLHKAAQALADRGVDAKTIDATIDKFRSQLANALDALSGAAGAGGSSPAPAGRGKRGLARPRPAPAPRCFEPPPPPAPPRPRFERLAGSDSAPPRFERYPRPGFPRPGTRELHQRQPVRRARSAQGTRRH